MQPTRDKVQVRKVIDVALEVSCDQSVPIVDRETRLRAARCLAEEAGLKEWLDVLDARIKNVV